MGKISPLAVLAGAVIDFGTTSTFMLVVMIYFVATHRRPLLDAMHTTPVRVLEFVVGCACSVIGAYIAGVLAKRAEILNGFLSTMVPSLLSWLAYLRHRSSLPWLWLVLGIIATPVTGILGGYLSLLQARRSEARA